MMLKCRRCSLLGLVALGGAAILLAQSMQSKMDMNDLPYAKVKAMLADPAQKIDAMHMAKMNHVVLMAGLPVEGKAVTWSGELTGANCYLSLGLRGHNHALCAKACVAAGSPVIFIHDRRVYTVLTGSDGMPLPAEAYDALGVAGATVRGQLVDSPGTPAIALQSVSR